MNAEEINAINRQSLEKRQSYQDSVRKNEQKADAFQRYKHSFPFYGFVDCRAEEAEFVMFSANDDVVAWEFFWTGAYEEEVVRQWSHMCRGADIVLDVGCYTGCMAMIACGVEPSCEVYCFEPMPRTIERLSINLKVNRLVDRVTVFPVAASDATSKVVMNLPRPVDFLGTGNSIQKKPNVDVMAQCEVDARRIDECCEIKDGRRLSCVKLDVEGYEFQALRGMEPLIDQHRPDFIIEIWPHEKKDIEAFMSRFGYTWRQLRGMNWLYEQS